MDMHLFSIGLGGGLTGYCCIALYGYIKRALDAV